MTKKKEVKVINEEALITPETYSKLVEGIQYDPITLVPSIMNPEILKIIDKIVNQYPEYTFYIDLDESEDLNYKRHRFNRDKTPYGIVTYNPITAIKYHEYVYELICYYYR